MEKHREELIGTLIQLEGTWLAEKCRRRIVIVVCKEVDELRVEIITMRAYEAGGSATLHGPWMDISKLKEYKGSQVAKDMDNFLWRFENNFKVTGIVYNAERVRATSMFLSDIAFQ